jgi:hypothetical protein
MSRSLAVKRDLLQLQQRAFQNSVLKVSLRTAQASMALAGATWLTSLLGQNVPSGLEHVAVAFPAMTLFSAGAGAAIYLSASRLTVRGGSAEATPNRLEALQAFLLQLDQRLDAARETLAAAAATLAQQQEQRLAAAGGAAGEAADAAAAEAAAADSTTMSRADFLALHARLTGAQPGESRLLFDMLTNGGSALHLADITSLSARVEGFHASPAAPPAAVVTRTP